MFKLAREVVVYDTEYTAWEGSQERGWSGPGEHQEIVQIGAVKTDTLNFEILDELLLFVKPVKNPILSDYFVKLTGIAQAEVDEKGVAYADALQQFTEWSEGLPLYSWGGDHEVMKKNAALIGVPFLIGDTRFFDAREIFQRRGIAVNNYMSSTILRAFGREPILRAHNGLDDARNVVEALKELSRKN